MTDEQTRYTKRWSKAAIEREVRFMPDDDNRHGLINIVHQLLSDNAALKEEKKELEFLNQDKAERCGRMATKVRKYRTELTATRAELEQVRYELHLYHELAPVITYNAVNNQLRKQPADPHPPATLAAAPEQQEG